MYEHKKKRQEPKRTTAPDQRIDLTFRDFYICANNYSLTNDERSQLGSQLSQKQELWNSISTRSAQNALSNVR